MEIKKLFDYTVPLTAGATILAGAFILVSVVGAYTAYEIKTAQDSITVTGSAKQAVVADTARWIINLESRTGVQEQQVGYTTIEDATKRIVEYLRAQNYMDIETPAVTSYPNYTYPQFGEPTMTGYIVSRQIIVRSTDVKGISDIASKIEPLSGPRYTVTTQSVELTYSKLDEARVTLLSEAIQDAKARADAIASESGRNIGVLRSASSGVVQVLSAGGIDEVSDYGMYDTQSMNKEVMVTVRATFSL